MKRPIETDTITNDKEDLAALTQSLQDISVENVKELINKGVNVNSSIEPDDTTPLLMILMSALTGKRVFDCLEIAENLLNAGAKLEEIRSNQLLHDVILNTSYNSKIILKFLLKKISFLLMQSVMVILHYI